MVFGTQELRNQIEGLTEERNFFQSKYLEQVSLIQKLETELRQSKREINRLRAELIEKSFESAVEEKKEPDPLSPTGFAIPDSPSGLTDSEYGEDPDENEAIRESASKLLQWASYRETRPSLDTSIDGDQQQQQEEEGS